MARAINPSVNPVSPENAIVVSADIRPKSFAEAAEDLEKSEYVSFSSAALASSFTLGNPGRFQMVRTARSARVSTQSA